MPLTFVLVPGTDVAWMLHLPNWFKQNPLPRVDSMEQLEQLTELVGPDANNNGPIWSRIPIAISPPRALFSGTGRRMILPSESLESLPETG